MRGDRISITRLIRGVLEDAPSEWMTMGQLMLRASINKTLANEVSSSLAKLRAAGEVATVKGPSSSNTGPPVVRKYRWVVVVVEPAPVRSPMGLGVFRI